MNLENYLKSNYSATSISGYMNMIKRFKSVMGERADEATYKQILDYIGQLRASRVVGTGQNLHPKSLRNNLLAIKIYFRYLVEIGVRTEHPCQYLYLKDQINRQIQVENLYDKATLEQFYQNYQAKKAANQRRNKIIISLLIYQALTVLEISQLRVQDVDLEAATIHIQENKKNRGRTLSLKPQQILLFHLYLEKEWQNYHQIPELAQRQNYFILSDNGIQIWKSGINRMINRGRDKHEKLTPLKIRQSVIAHLLKENNDIRIVQAFAGHRRTASTEAYKQTGLEELKSAIHNFHPYQR